MQVPYGGNWRELLIKPLLVDSMRGPHMASHYASADLIVKRLCARSCLHLPIRSRVYHGEEVKLLSASFDGLGFQ
jgi:hypothetical protein